MKLNLISRSPISALKRRPGHCSFTAAFLCHVLWICLALGCVPGAFAASVTLRPSADTTLFENNPDNNLGATTLAAGTTKNGQRSRALIYFNLANQVPAGATITSVQLSLRVVKAPPGPVPSTFGLHRVLQDWGEGNKTGLTGADAADGEATWNVAAVPDVAWSAPGAAAPDDYAAQASASRSVAGVASYTFATTAGLVADVQAWLANPQANFGWILVSQSEAAAKTARRFGSKEDAARAPSLVIEYTEGPALTAPSITTGPANQTVLTGGTATFSVVAAGSEPLAYQWKFNNVDIPNANAATLTLNNVQAANAGSYSVAVSNQAGSVVSSAATLTVTPPPSSGKKWTIMVYGHADHNLSPSLVVDMQEMEAVGSSDDFNIVVQADFDASSQATLQGGLPANLAQGITRFRIQKDQDPAVISSPAVERLPESLNMDDPAVLTQFITWAAQKYPADRYGLVLWNHGGQWAGFGGDSQDNTLQDKGILNTAQIRQAVNSAMQSSGIQKWDFVSFDTCLMGGAEVFSDFVPLSDVFIACAELDYGDGWDYNAALEFLKTNPTTSAMDFGRAEVRAWEAHHMQPGKDSDLELAAHGLYDLTKYAAFEREFNAFGALLTQATALRASVLPRLRQLTTQYSLAGVKEMGKPTDYIDLGELADRLIAEPSVDAALKASASSMNAAIDAMVIAKVRGAKKQLTRGVSVYYPIAGSSNDPKYLGLGINSNPNSSWGKFLAGVTTDRAADTTAPDIASTQEDPAEPQNTASGSLAAAPGQASLAASSSQPAVFKVKVVSGSDAFGMFGSIVDSRFTGAANEFVYLGEIVNAPINGVGTYDIVWNTTLPMLSSSSSPTPVALGGFFDDIGSDLRLSFADYVPPGESDAQLVILMTQIRGGKPVVIGVMDGAEEDEGLGPRGIDLVPGGLLTPVYYMERRVGDDPAKWESSSSNSKSSVVIPANGLAGLSVTLTPVPNGVYNLEVQVVDFFKNESEVLNYTVQVGQSGSEGPRMSVRTATDGKIVVSWPASAGDYVLESNVAATANGWIQIPASSIVTDGTTKSFSEIASGAAKYYRLKK